MYAAPQGKEAGMKMKIIGIVVAGAFLWSGVGAVWAVPSKSGTKRVKSATVTKEETFGQIDASKALVYVIRPTSWGFGVDTWTFSDDKFIGMNRGKSYFYTYLDPGRHLIWTKSENISPLEISFEPGKAYYFEEHILMGAFTPRVKLEQISEEEGRAAIEKHEFKMLSPTEDGVRRGGAFAAKHYATAQKNWEKRKAKGEDPDEPTATEQSH